MRPRILILTVTAAALSLGLLACSQSWTDLLDAMERGESQGPAPGLNVAGPTPRLAHVDVDQGLLDANRRFALNLLKTIAEGEPGENVFISPTSVSVALQMTWNGASGETKRAMAQALELSEIELDRVNVANQALLSNLMFGDEHASVTIANSLWTREGFPPLESFLDRNRRYYDAEITALNFADPASRDIINGWISDETDGLITDVLDYVPPDAILYLVNAILFDAKWQSPFISYLTEERDFALADSSVVRVPFMTRMGSGSFDAYTHASYGKVEGAEILSLPFGEQWQERSRFSFRIILPAEPDGLDEVLASLDPGRWAAWRDSSRWGYGIVRLPRFQFGYKNELKDELTERGMGVAFGEGSADFSEMFDLERLGKNVFINRVIHQTFLDVNEEGVKAAGATVVEMFPTSGPPPPDFVISINRPFLCAIVDDETGTILFIGAIYDPR